MGEARWFVAAWVWGDHAKLAKGIKAQRRGGKVGAALVDF